ncbi:methionyl-tRNA formyltransferase [Haloferula rosea]|uniref:Methionyl-tRNA formyltransferase n=1 Tax=Haloferula rosea TaxID=490093 RepID=A0A934RAJ9_9BACT|nr:methionyl-tRNA formyltransferase [Haloferula rosea]MBK1826975.1 methionyl-tRNA formyltransferase [Haloferula rosea]
METERIIFLGTGDIAIPSFEWLIESGRVPVALVTQPDRPAGRRRQMKAPRIKEIALAHGIEVLQPERVRESGFLDELEGLAPDLMVVMAYGQILPQRLIEMAPLGCVNLHASLLPKYRGAACIQAAIDAGDASTGVTLMHVVKQLDAGDVIVACETPIRATDTGGSIHDRLAEVAVDALKAGLPGLLDGSAERRSQAEMGEISHVPKLGRDDGRLDWSWSAARIERRLRAYDPWPGCWAEYDDSGTMRRIKIFPVAELVELHAEAGSIHELDGRLCVACGDGGLALAEVQPDGSRRMAAGDWWRGMRGDGPKGLH